MKFSAPAKLHLLGEHSVVYGKPAILAAINLRVTVSITRVTGTTSTTGLNSRDTRDTFTTRGTLENIIKKRFNLKTIPPYSVKIDSQIPIGYGLGSSASISASFIAALLSFLKIKWDLNLINELAFEAEKVFHGNPSGGDNTTVVYGGMIWYRKELPFLKSFAPLPFKIHKNIRSFYLIDCGKPVETTKQMIERAKSKIKDILEDQEILVKELAVALKDGDEKNLIRIIKRGERNLEKIGVVGKKAKEIIRKVEKSGGAAKILGGGGFKDGSGMILCYHGNLKGTKITLGETGLRQEND